MANNMNQDEIDALAADWDGAHMDRIRRFCTQEEVVWTPQSTKADLINRLIGFGFRAYQAYLPAPIVQQPDIQPRRAKLTLRSQGLSEELTDYLKHAELFFNLDHTDDEAKLGHLVGKVKNEVSVAIEDQFNAGVTDYPTIRDNLLQRFAVSRFDRLVRFRIMKPSTAENLIQFGARLRAEYLKYLLLTENQTQPMEQALMGALMAQLFDVIDSGITTQVKNKIYEDPDLTWTDILKIAENFRQTTTKSLGYIAARSYNGQTTGQYLRFAGQSPRSFTGQNQRPAGQSFRSFAGQPVKIVDGNQSIQTSFQPIAYCEFHQSVGHSTEDCHDRKMAEVAQGQVSSPPIRNSAVAVKCYNCHKEGHYARSCPQLTSENGQPDPLSPESVDLASKTQSGRHS
jgi:hypothetical protein